LVDYLSDCESGSAVERAFREIRLAVESCRGVSRVDAGDDARDEGEVEGQVVFLCLGCGCKLGCFEFGWEQLFVRAVGTLGLADTVPSPGRRMRQKNAFLTGRSVFFSASGGERKWN